MKTADFDYVLPPELIAQVPAEPRDSSRLLILDRGRGATLHRRFQDVCEYLREGDLLVFNDTRVIPARLHGSRKSGGHVEVLLLRKQPDGLWEALVRPRRVKPGEVVALGGRPTDASQCAGSMSCLEAEIGGACGGGARMVRFSHPELVSSVGDVPLPPYIRTPLSDPERYQTV
ncbi:MAG: S-adenosylmethionine:tRNA ribosyltransferase-isomerase, partial [Chloroflexi bacterium]|nr:S-adenosylmethionine:tRNA ribosyltransferase-isomerase [Chloroflexota bacterium]